MMLRKGDRGPAVKALQLALVAKGYDVGGVDSWFWTQTDKSVRAFQTSQGLEPNGIADEALFTLLEGTVKPKILDPPNRVMSFPASPYGNGFENFHLRDDVGEAYKKVFDTITGMGGLLPSSGGIRSLKEKVSAGRSATSFHYTGRALDVNIYSALQKPDTDPLVVSLDSEMTAQPRWRVYARIDEGETMILSAATWTAKGLGFKKTTGIFIDLSALFKEHGFSAIRARKGWEQDYLCLEWWHFQYEAGLIAGKSTFGEELRKIYTLSQLEASAPWKFKDRIWAVNWG